MSGPLDNAGQIYPTVFPQLHDDAGEVNLEAEALTLRKGFTPFHTNPEPLTNPVPSKNPDISITFQNHKDFMKHNCICEYDYKNLLE